LHCSAIVRASSSHPRRQAAVTDAPG
jgi:hypothetical protein